MGQQVAQLFDSCMVMMMMMMMMMMMQADSAIET
jgi:hypothetical protein